MEAYKAWILEKNAQHPEEIITVIPEYLFNEFKNWRQFKSDQAEACGIIYGERRGRHFLVTGITTPMITDVRSRYACKRNIRGHQEVLDQLHKQSNGKIQYLGEWHSHPQKIALPSPMDLREWKNSYEYLHKEQNIDKMLCLILGVEKDWIGIYEQGQLHYVHNVLIFNA